jgi:hypothetical protein
MFYGAFPEPGDKQFFGDALRRFVRMFRRVYAGDNVILFDRNLGYRRDPDFKRAFTDRAKSDQETSLELRLNTLIWAATHALHVPGDFVECGVLRGFCSAVIVDYLNFATVPKTYYLYDTFSGIPAEFDTEHHDQPNMHAPRLYENVCERFAPYPNVRVVKGIVPHVLHEAAPEKIAFLHLDMNSSKSEIAALEVLFDRISPGGIVIFDDYGWLMYQAQQIAEDEFARQRDYRILELPTGQGLLLKR